MYFNITLWRKLLTNLVENDRIYHVKVFIEQKLFRRCKVKYLISIVRSKKNATPHDNI